MNIFDELESKTLVKKSKQIVESLSVTTGYLITVHSGEEV
jgi:hypothetical protein